MSSPQFDPRQQHPAGAAPATPKPGGARKILVIGAAVLVLGLIGHAASDSSTSGGGTTSTTTNTQYGSTDNGGGGLPVQPPDPALNNDWDPGNYIPGGGLGLNNP